MSFHLISLLLLRTHGRDPSMFVHNLLHNRFSVAQVFTMRWVFIGCPCALASLSLQPHTPLSRLVLVSCLHSFVLLRTHVHNRRDLRVSRLPSGRRVYVCTPWNHRDPFGLFRFDFNFEGAGGRSQVGGLRPTKTPPTWV